ncbi:hypothetical protein GX408_15645 [bacterium]|nr:hypothetical protein [bacterium]
MSKLNARYGFVLLSAGLLMAGFGLLLIRALQPAVLPIGSRLKPVSCRTCTGADTLRPSAAGQTLVLLFSVHCPHCLYELDQLDRHLFSLPYDRFYLLTMDNRFDLCNGTSRWLNLSAGDRVTWAVMDKSVFHSHFGRSVKPTLFVFDGRGILRKKWSGEIKMEKLAAVYPQVPG